MTDEDKQPSSKLIVDFAGPGSTLFQLQLVGVVTVGQLEALAHDLLSQAQYTRYAQIHQMAMAQKDKPKIVVPSLQVKPN